MAGAQNAGGGFITLEGGEGSGKTTAAAALARALEATGLTVLQTREPGGAPGAEEIRSLLVAGRPERWDPMSEALLHFAARREHVARTIRPALDRGFWVVCDRFFDSTAVYQGYGQGLDPEAVAHLRALVLGTFAPDLTLVLDVPPDVGLARETGAGEGTRYGRMGADFHDRVRQGFLEIAAAEPDRCTVIDASKDREAVQGAVWAAVTALGLTEDA